MNLPRRKFLHLAAGAAVLSASSQVVLAQVWPRRRIRWIVPAAAGNTSDIGARLIGQWLSERLHQPVIIENRPGAGGNTGTEVGVRAPPDGYTLFLVFSPQVINATLYDNLNVDLIRDVAPVAGISRAADVMEVNPSFPARTVPEFIAYAKANPGKINFASAGVGTTPHVAGELFKLMTGVNMVHVPYRGIPAALTDLISGQVQVMFDSIPSSIGYIRDGKLRPLAVTSAMRWDGLPDVATVGDFVPGFEVIGFGGVGVPANTPTEIVERLNREINAGLADPKMIARLSGLGLTPMPMTPAEFGKLVADETEKWGKVIRAANIKAE
jgi:tripartite-type tricarboxylate transporter receptor subunit TctC